MALKTKDSVDMVDESLLKAEHSMGFVISDLRYSMLHSTIVDPLVVLKFIEQADDLLARIKQFREAVVEDHRHD